MLRRSINGSFVVRGCQEELLQRGDMLAAVRQGQSVSQVSSHPWISSNQSFVFFGFTTKWVSEGK